MVADPKGEFVPDVTIEIDALGKGGPEIGGDVRRDIKIAIDAPAGEFDLQLSLGGAVAEGADDAGRHGNDNARTRRPGSVPATSS
jgi:hypothetical protein